MEFRGKSAELLTFDGPPVVNRAWRELVASLDHPHMLTQDLTLRGDYQPVRISAPNRPSLRRRAKRLLDLSPASLLAQSRLPATTPDAVVRPVEAAVGAWLTHSARWEVAL